MAKIIATAENYSFGPAGKLVTICQKLIDQGHEVTFIGEGTAYQLASKANFKKIYRFDTDSKEFMTWGKDILKKADVLISSVDRSSVILAQEIGLPTIWVDMLFWWWDEIPKFLFDVNLYIQQNSLRNKPNTKKYASKLKNMVIVGPIIDESYKNTSVKNQLLISFGGMDAAGWYQIGKDSNYPYTISELLLKKVDMSIYDKVIFAGNEKISSDLDKRYGNKKFEFKILPHKAWLKAVAQSKDILVNPGLEGPFDVIAHERPMFFLPPYNSSAYVELEEFRRRGVANRENSIHFTDYFPYRSLGGRNLRLIMKEFLSELKKIENSPEILDDCARRINKYLKSSRKTKQKQIARQKKFLSLLGGNGLEKTINIINDFIDILDKQNGT
ncbi:MAG: hypothetical protein Q8P26_00785 [Candidatus Levybacteria bacterium]|nr:hypothetical protein [Candidatus Levybacteria bacterium]